MKKLIIALLTLSLVFAFCACSDNSTDTPTDPATEANNERCYHNFKSEITLEATCEAEGTLTYTCTLCEFSYDEVIDITNHSFSKATCTDGEFCAYCGTYNSDALGHDYSDASCTDAAVCTRCGQVDGEPLGHNYEEGVCLNCGQDEPEA